MLEWREGIEETRLLRLLENWELDKLLCWDDGHDEFEGNSQIIPFIFTGNSCAKLRNGKINIKKNKWCGRDQEQEEAVMTVVDFVGSFVILNVV